MTDATKQCCSNPTFTLWVDGKLRTYDYPPEPPGYSHEQMYLSALVRDWLFKQRRKLSVEASK